MTLALRAVREAVEAPRRTGPVTDAIRTMRATMARFDADPDVRALRRALADRIESDLAVPDMLGGDADEEPSLGAPELPDSQYLLTGPDGRPYRPGDQARWAAGVTDDQEQDADDEPEEENERGGDMNALDDHDAEGDTVVDGIAGEGELHELSAYFQACFVVRMPALATRIAGE